MARVGLLEMPARQWISTVFPLFRTFSEKATDYSKASIILSRPPPPSREPYNPKKEAVCLDSRREHLYSNGWLLTKEFPSVFKVRRQLVLVAVVDGNTEEMLVVHHLGTGHREVDHIADPVFLK